MKYPIIILSKERPLQLRDMVCSIVERTDPDTYEIIICDNDSRQPEMKEYLKSQEEKHTIIYNPENNGFEGFNPGLKLVKTEFFILSDPDIVLNQKTPIDWILRLVETMKIFMTPKIGLALSIDLDVNIAFEKDVIEREQEYWGDTGSVEVANLGAPCFAAPVDTTLAMYRRDTYDFWINRELHFNHGDGIAPAKIIHQNQYNPKYYVPTLRVAGNYAATHTGWDTSDRYKNDFEYYKHHCDLDLASTVKWRITGKPTLPVKEVA